MDIFEDAIVPETPKALPNEQLFVYVPIGTIDYPGIVTFDGVDFRIDEHGRVYMKVSSTQNAKDIDILKSARPVTGSFSVGDALWAESDDGYTATIALADNPLQSGDVMLILPDGEDTRNASADVVVSVKSAQNGDEADAIVLTAKSKPAVTPLWYRYAVIKRGAKDNTMLPVAFIVGANDVPKYIKDAIETFKDRLTTGGTILVPKGDWGDSEQNVAVQIKLGGNVLKPGTLMVLAPANDATKQIVAEYGMSMRVDKTVDGPDKGVDVVVLVRKPGKIPEQNLTFCYAVIVIGGNTTPIATLVGGLGGGGNGGEEFYVGEDEPPATATVWIDPSGDPTNTETWEFVMENGDTVTKELVVVDD